MISLMRRALAWLRRLLMPAPTPVYKYIDLYVLDADQQPESGTVTATLVVPAPYERITDVADRTVIEADESITVPIDETGRAVLPLRPNNLPGDTPLNTHWLITEPSGHTESIFIAYNAVGGDTRETAINYLSLLEDPGNLPAPGDTTLSDRVADLEAVVAAMNTLDSAALTTLGADTDLVDAASSGAAEATSSSPGLMPAADKAKVDAIDTARLVLLDAAGGGIVIPSRADYTGVVPAGTSRLWTSASDGQTKVRTASSTTPLAPALDSPQWMATTDIAIPTSAFVTLATLDIEPSRRYFVICPIRAQGPADDDIRFKFINLPAGASMTYSNIALAQGTVGGAGGVGSIDTNSVVAPNPVPAGLQGSTSPQGVVLVGTLTVGTTDGSVTFQAAKATTDTGADAAILTGSAVYLLPS